MRTKSNSEKSMKTKSGQEKPKKAKSVGSIGDKGYTSISDNEHGFIFANTPLNMEDEENNPDCC